MFKIILITSSIISAYCENDYYWRDYFGTVPGDAIVGGVGIDGKNVYIGQAYIKNAGLVVAQITPGVREVYAPIGGMQKADKYIKILCGVQENFYWLKTNSSHLHIDVTDKHPVIGGHEDAYGYMHIGRISYAGDIIIGKVNSFSVGRAGFHYNEHGSEKNIWSYEVLIYKNGDFLDGLVPRIGAN